jgi:hypothetical protein
MSAERCDPMRRTPCTLPRHPAPLLTAPFPSSACTLQPSLHTNVMGARGMGALEAWGGGKGALELVACGEREWPR